MNDIIDACRRLSIAFRNAGMTPPALVSVDPDAFRQMRRMAGTEGTLRYAAQGLEVIEITGIKFTDKLPQGIFHPDHP